MQIPVHGMDPQQQDSLAELHAITITETADALHTKATIATLPALH
jgi:hypothetical protein